MNLRKKINKDVLVRSIDTFLACDQTYHLIWVDPSPKNHKQHKRRMKDAKSIAKISIDRITHDIGKEILGIFTHLSAWIRDNGEKHADKSFDELIEIYLHKRNVF